MFSKHRKLFELTTALAASMGRWLPPEGLSGTSPAAVERQTELLSNGLASRARRHRERYGWGLFGTALFERTLHRRLADIGYETSFARATARRIAARASTKT